MGAFYAKQPNGRYCRFSKVVDCITDINIPDVSRDRPVFSFVKMIDCFIPNNMPTAQFNKLLREMGYDGEPLAIPQMSWDPYKKKDIPIEEPEQDYPICDHSGEETPIEKAHRRYKELRREGKIRTPEQKFRDHPTPLRAIRLFCIDCQGGSRKGPAICDTKNCPLWKFRMGKMGKRAKNAPPSRKATSPGK